jgi:PASTA domain
MKAAFAALLAAALVFTLVLVGLGTTPDVLRADPVELGTAADEVKPLQARSHSERPREGRRDELRHRRARNVDEVPNEVEAVALADINDNEVDTPTEGNADTHGRDAGPGSGDGANVGPGPDPDDPGDDEDHPGGNPSPPTSDNRVAVPHLVGMDKDAARDSLESAGLEDGDISQRDSCAEDDQVLSQSIAPGTRVPRGTSVSFTISTGESPDDDNSGSRSESC